jgi:sugar phosphate isomerase/epimerase
MQQLHDVARPGILISNTWPTSRERQGETLERIETVLEDGYFQAIQTVEVPTAQERKDIARVLEAMDYPLTYCLTRILNERKMSLADLDEGNRRRSYELAIRCLDDARQAGATYVSVISGPTPEDPSRREEAVQRLGDSLIHVCRAAETTPALSVIVEPLDHGVHKKCALGLVSEAVDLCREAEQARLDLRLCVDTAHVILNGEDPVEALATAQPWLAEYHYCNAVTDQTHHRYGDWHLPFGEPGVVSIDTISHIMGRSLDLGFFSPQRRPSIFCEVLSREEYPSLWVMQHCKNALQQAWEMLIQSR